MCVRVALRFKDQYNLKRVTMTRNYGKPVYINENNGFFLFSFTSYDDIFSNIFDELRFFFIFYFCFVSLIGGARSFTMTTIHIYYNTIPIPMRQNNVKIYPKKGIYVCITKRNFHFAKQKLTDEEDDNHRKQIEANALAHTHTQRPRHGKSVEKNMHCHYGSRFFVFVYIQDTMLPSFDCYVSKCITFIQKVENKRKKRETMKFFFYFQYRKLAVRRTYTFYGVLLF